MQKQSLSTSLKETDAQPISKQQPPWKLRNPTSFFFYLSFIAEHGAIWYGIPL